MSNWMRHRACLAIVMKKNSKGKEFEEQYEDIKIKNKKSRLSLLNFTNYVKDFTKGVLY